MSAHLSTLNTERKLQATLDRGFNKEDGPFAKSAYVLLIVLKCEHRSDLIAQAQTFSNEKH